MELGRRSESYDRDVLAFDRRRARYVRIKKEVERERRKKSGFGKYLDYLRQSRALALPFLCATPAIYSLSVHSPLENPDT